MDKTVAEFAKANPMVTLKEFEEIIKMAVTVAFIPQPLFEKYRNSGKSVQEVYKEITSHN